MRKRVENWWRCPLVDVLQFDKKHGIGTTLLTVRPVEALWAEGAPQDGTAFHLVASSLAVPAVAHHHRHLLLLLLRLLLFSVCKALQTVDVQLVLDKVAQITQPLAFAIVLLAVERLLHRRQLLKGPAENVRQQANVLPVLRCCTRE